MRLLSTPTRRRICTEDRDGKGTTTAYVADFSNALHQTRQIAYDLRRWWVQAKYNDKTPFTPIGEGEIPTNIKAEFSKIEPLQTLRQNVRNFLLAATPEELEKERLLSLNNCDYYRAFFISQLQAENGEGTDAGITSCNGAFLAGFTEEIEVVNQKGEEACVMVKPAIAKTLKQDKPRYFTFTAFNTDLMEMVKMKECRYLRP